MMFVHDTRNDWSVPRWPPPPDSETRPPMPTPPAFASTLLP